MRESNGGMHKSGEGSRCKAGEGGRTEKEGPGPRGSSFVLFFGCCPCGYSHQIGFCALLCPEWLFSKEANGKAGPAGALVADWGYPGKQPELLLQDLPALPRTGLNSLLSELLMNFSSLLGLTERV